MSMKPYAELIARGKELVQEGLAPVRANATRKKLELKIAELEEKSANLAAKVEEACSKYPLDIDAVINAMDEVALVERKVVQCRQLIADLFPEKGV